MTQSIKFLGLAMGLAWLAGGAYVSEGFILWEPQWWVWLGRAWAFHGHPPVALAAHFGLAIFIMLVCGVAGARLLPAASDKTVIGGVLRRHVHGSAKWATRSTVRATGLFAQRGITLGLFPGQKRRPMRHNGPEHAICFAPTRSGKGVSVVIPTLLEWPESAITLDIKGENHALTSGWRASIGQRVVRFEPTAENGSARFNPLKEIRIGTANEMQDIQNVATMIVDPDGKGMIDFWARSGFEWLTAVLRHALYRTRIEEGRTANLADVKYILQGEHGDANADGDAAEAMLDAIIRFDHLDDEVDRHVHATAREMLARAQPERSGVMSNVSINLGLYVDPIIAANTATSDFRISDIANGEAPMSLYLVVPPSDIDRLRPLLRLFFNLALRRMTSEMAFKKGRSVASARHRLLLVLDEFTALGKLEIMEKSLAFMAGYNLKCLIIVQDISQLHSVYTRTESIMSNCNIRMVFAPNKIETAEMLSKMAGKATVVTRKRSKSRSSSKGGAGTSESLSDTARPLLTPDEFMRLDAAKKNLAGDVVSPGSMVIFSGGEAPILARQRLYFMEPELLRRAKKKPVSWLPERPDPRTGTSARCAARSVGDEIRRALEEYDADALANDNHDSDRDAVAHNGTAGRHTQ